MTTEDDAYLDWMAGALLAEDRQGWWAALRHATKQGGPRYAVRLFRTAQARAAFRRFAS